MQTDFVEISNKLFHGIHDCHNPSCEATIFPFKGKIYKFHNRECYDKYRRRFYGKRTCPVCGENFMPPRPDQKHCSGCYKKRGSSRRETALHRAINKQDTKIDLSSLPKMSEIFSPATTTYNDLPNDDCLGGVSFIDPEDVLNNDGHKWRTKSQDQWSYLDIWQWFCDSAVDADHHIPTATFVGPKEFGQIKALINKVGGTMKLIEILGATLEKFSLIAERLGWDRTAVGPGHILQSIEEIEFMIRDIVKNYKIVYEIHEVERITSVETALWDNDGRVKKAQWWRIPDEKWAAATAWAYITAHADKMGMPTRKIQYYEKKMFKELCINYGHHTVIGVVRAFPELFIGVHDYLQFDMPFRMRDFCQAFKSFMAKFYYMQSRIDVYKTNKAEKEFRGEIPVVGNDSTMFSDW